MSAFCAVVGPCTVAVGGGAFSVVGGGFGFGGVVGAFGFGGGGGGVFGFEGRVVAIVEGAFVVLATGLGGLVLGDVLAVAASLARVAPADSDSTFFSFFVTVSHGESR